MNTKLPPEIPVNRSLDGLAPRFRLAVEGVLRDLPSAMVSESLRTYDRQHYLYGFGRDYDDGRGIVTNAQSNLYSWHGYGLAVDIIHSTLEWNAGYQWFKTLGNVAKIHGLHWGGDWTHPDNPHVQWGLCRDTPSDRARQLYAAGGPPSVWQAVGAI